MFKSLGKWFSDKADGWLIARFGLPNNATLIRKDYSWDIAVPGTKVFRTCGVIHSPNCIPPYTKDNWSYKICAIVLWRVKVFSFTAVNIVPR